MHTPEDFSEDARVIDSTLKDVAHESARRRTFAIISHPDAGKTTLTEKLLLYSGMIAVAGMVRARKGGRATSSDWMALEQERGISVSASAMQFPYKDALINVLDTPGHQDFSEDTYRTLTAADSAVMVLDAAKGVEAQTRKLFAVCRMQKTPILTFINKMDLPGKEPLALLQEVEDVLGIAASPLCWPIGSGSSFRGIVYPDTRQVLLFSRSQIGGAGKAIFRSLSLSDAVTSGELEPAEGAALEEELELLAVAGNPFDPERYLAGEQTPVFFGSALTNFGVEPFFDRFTQLAPAPHAYRATTTTGEEISVDPVTTPFSAYVFKIQANMNPRHRDSMAFLRVCSGRFERDMVVRHHRSGKDVRLARSYSMVAQDRTTVDMAYPGDIIGVINPGVFAIGDTVSLRGGFNFRPMPQFPPEVVAQIRPTDVLRHKSFEKGISQLASEGAVQILRSYRNPKDPPLVAAVGRLQFEVLQFRLKDEYGVTSAVDILPYKFSLYVHGDATKLTLPLGAMLGLDARDRVVALLKAEWEKNYLREKNPNHSFTEYRELESAEDRLTWLMERTPLQVPLPFALRTPEGRMPGCLSGLWIRGEVREGQNERLCFFQCASESAVVQGIAAVLCDLVSARPAAEVLECAELFATALRLDGLLTATRRRAVATVTGYFCQCARNAVAPERPSA